MRRFVFVVALIVVAGCAPTNQFTGPHTVINTETYDVPFDQAWSALVTVLAERELPIQVVERSSGLITTQFVSFASGITAENSIKEVARLNCSICDIRAGRYSLNAIATRPDENQTTVHLAVHVEGFDHLFGSGWRQFETNGAIENEVFQAMHQRIGPAAQAFSTGPHRGGALMSEPAPAPAGTLAPPALHH